MSSFVKSIYLTYLFYYCVSYISVYCIFYLKLPKQYIHLQGVDIVSEDTLYNTVIFAFIKFRIVFQVTKLNINVPI